MNWRQHIGTNKGIIINLEALLCIRYVKDVKKRSTI